MSAPDCPKIREGLSAYLEGDLDTAETSAIRAHLEQCADCRAELELQRQTIGALRSLPDLPPPAGILAGVRARLEPEPWYRRLAGGRRWLLGVPVGAVATVLVVVGVSFFQSRFTETEKMGAPAPLPTYPQPAATAEPTAPVASEPMALGKVQSRVDKPLPPATEFADESAKDANEQFQRQKMVAPAPAPRERPHAAREESDAKARAVPAPQMKKEAAAKSARIADRSDEFRRTALGGERSTISQAVRIVCLLLPDGGTVDEIKRLLERAGAGEVKLEALAPSAVREAFAPHREKADLPREAAGGWSLTARVQAQGLTALIEELAARPGLRILEEPADVPAAVDPPEMLDLRLMVLN